MNQSQKMILVESLNKLKPPLIPRQKENQNHRRRLSALILFDNPKATL